MSSVNTRLDTVAIAQGTTWGTEATVGALDGAYVQPGFSGFSLTRGESPDMGAGFGLEANSEQGNDNVVPVNMTLWPYEDGKTALKLLAGLLGDDTTAGVADPYTHTLDMQEESGIFWSVAGQEGAEDKVIVSAFLEEWTMSFNGQGICEWSFSGKGNTVEGTTISGVTYQAQTGVYLFRNTSLKMNAQAGADVAAETDLGITDLTLKITRPSDEVYVTGSTNIAQPKEGPFPEAMIEFTIPHKNSDSQTLYTAWAAQTLQKCQIIITGSANRSITISMPQVKLQEVTNPWDDVISTKVIGRLQTASTAPTGMTGITVPIRVVVENSIATSVLA